ncbi:cytochrome P450 [Xylaria arbuscula]|nr:cytochrome P450 [Xylaria arbuscula]
MSTYMENKGLTFAIPALTGYQVLVSLPTKIQELARAPKHVISFHEAMKDRLNHRLIMFGFEHNAVDPNDSVPIHVLKVQLRKHMGELRPVIVRRISEAIEHHLQKSQHSERIGTWTVSIFAFTKDVTNLVNNQVLFGSDLASNEDFQKDTLRYGWDGAIAMEACRLVPGLIASVVAKGIMGWSGAMDRVGKQVTELVKDRLKARNTKFNITHIDCTEFVINASRTPAQKAPGRIVQQLVALLFASAHQLPMAISWALTMLSIHSEYVELLRNEILSLKDEEGAEFSLRKLPLLDCFLRESSRLNPLDGLSIQRKATKDFTFSDKSRIPAGNLVAVPQQAVMRDEKNYKNPDTFDPFRFMPSDHHLDPVVNYTDVNWTYPFWGSPVQSW